MRMEEDLYRRPVRSGGPRTAPDRFNSDHFADQNSLSDFNSSEPAFELDHLATFAAGSIKKGTMHVEDGLRKLRQMENTTGIWTMRCVLLVERRFLVILDKNSGEELERFPMNMIQEPTAVFKNDRREIYNNLVLFTVMDDSSRKEPHADMHIFQSARTPAQSIVDEIFAAKRGQNRISSTGEAVLSKIFATHSFKIDGWEGQAVRREIAQAAGLGIATANQNTVDYQSGAEHAFQNNSYVSGVTATESSGFAQYNQSGVGHTAGTRGNAIQEPVVYLPRDGRKEASSAMQHMELATGVQKHTHVVTQHTTTTTTNQTWADIENGAVSSSQQRESMQDQSAGNKHGYKIPPVPTGPAPDQYNIGGGLQETIEERRYNQSSSSQYGVSQFANGGGLLGGAQRSSMVARPSYSPYKDREDEFGNNELLERDVQLLNHCFDDVEKFVARLQQAAEAFKELERRKRERGGKGKKNLGGDGMLGHRARPPPAQDFVDIFQKFKLAFNLLAKLKAHIHDPNAPELVHFLFTPLGLIYEASRDPIHGSVNLGEQAVAPVLSQDAKQLLVNCLTSKEIELWQSLGKNWTTSKEEWKGYIPPYVPRFYDGWQPAPTVVEEPASRASLESAVAAHHNQILNRQQEQDVRDYVRDRVMPFPPEEERFSRERATDFQHFEPDRSAPSPPRDVMSNPSVVGYQQYVEQHIDRTEEGLAPGNPNMDLNYQANQRRAPEPAPHTQPEASQPPPDDNMAYLYELKKMEAKVYEVLHERQGKNSKELTVNKGDYLQVLDNSRNWWKVRNYKGQSGYCPYTILKEVTNMDQDRGGIDTGTTPSADRGGSKPDQRSDELDTQFPGKPKVSSQFENPHDSFASKQFDMGDPPIFSVEEEEGGQHAFRPVEPALYSNKGIKGIRQTQPQIDLHNELKSKMGHSHQQHRAEERKIVPEILQPPLPPTSSPPGSTVGVQAFYMTKSSSQDHVSSWLESKGFSTLCRRTLQGFTGTDLFSLHRHEMEQLIGHDEAARLEGQLTLQKKMTGYKTQTAAELNAIFQKRRARSDLQGAAVGQPPDFRPQTPSSCDDHDSDSDDLDRQLTQTGKTLRDLLIRQRQKIVGTSVFDQQ
ncbi:epidermal growth factor receptor kinase substrate 8-like protein 1 isoform X2 [Babylonia areolata]|uniref:epidermal growth factor receptor kinase substrate 8-like protein 1 isoform X2 n=1 Tax=Babylonia areolata TaxID=304850 RepID=UPI003FD6A85B